MMAIRLPSVNSRVSESTDFLLMVENLGFQEGNARVWLDSPLSLFNSSQTYLRITSGTGLFYFRSNNSMTMRVNYGGVTSVFVKGDQGQERRGVTNNTVVSIDANDLVTVDWRIDLIPLLPLGFIFGMFGIVASFLGPYMAIKRLQKGNYQDGLIIGTVVTSIGVAFVLVWLWS